MLSKREENVKRKRTTEIRFVNRNEYQSAFDLGSGAHRSFDDASQIDCLCLETDLT